MDKVENSKEHDLKQVFSQKKHLVTESKKMPKKKEIKVGCYVNLFDTALNDKSLDLDCRVLYCYFHSLTNQGKTIEVSNDYLAAMLNSTTRNVRNKLTYLVEHGYIKRKITRKKVDGKATAYREITAINKYGTGVCTSTYIEENQRENISTPSDQKENYSPCQEENISHNTKVLNIKENTYYTNTDLPPQLDDETSKLVSISFEKLRKYSFDDSHLNQMLNSPKVNNDKIPKYLDYMLHDLVSNNRLSKINKTAPDYFLGVLLSTGELNPPNGYKDPDETQRLQEEQLKAKKQKQQELINKEKLIKLESFTKQQLKEWRQTKLTEELKLQILNTPENLDKISKQLSGQDTLKNILIKKYFKQEVLPLLIAEHDDSDLLDAFLIENK